MGYRSDVTFAFYPRDEVKGWLEKHWPQEWTRCCSTTST